jgi:hypothetical protein
MTALQEAGQELDLSKLVPQKFHHLCFELAVAFETTYVPTTEIKYSETFAFPDLVLRSQKGGGPKVHCPAVPSGDLEKDGVASVSFVPWVESGDVLFCRLCLRLQTIGRSHVYRPVFLARSGEEKAFGFNLQNIKGSYINLSFLGYGNREFKPVYIKIRTDNGSVVYYELSAVGSEDGVFVEIQKVSENDTPYHLQVQVV